jgi:hypothetical protein
MGEDKIEKMKQEFSALPKRRQQEILSIIHLWTARDLYQSCQVCGKDIKEEKHSVHFESLEASICYKCFRTIGSFWDTIPKW